ncbi:zf-PARP-domain-containing protein [Aspergillus eucalypticola CBS 122712]|uniref:Zf-PARP-domain-containing protein n=1 Tax=Aspergillus eucalypticola (strain CBS 122712 / IBT 29274) TaxID=1448314 RepID=A0A317V2Z1_ASPEC|nr:zf-PARP-domain-containing protein [Aspergillus eucalypticola CBS 122712]PWY66560.1 zf-PARP-domain-containing protein [Aspergillus eucalypticola CBS 122712]
MGAYRLEQASTGRAGCKNKECKDQGIKILKGELRHGSWVDTERFQSYFWRHWGCVTPKIIANMVETVGEEGERDWSALDGYDELPEDLQEKVRTAIEQGHVDDEDWKGDVELNRPGKTGFRKRVTKKDNDETQEESTPKKATPQSKKRARAEPKEESGSEAEAEDTKEKPKTKKATPQTKKRARAEPKKEAESDAEEEATKETPKTKKATPQTKKRTKAGAEADADEAKETPKTKKPRKNSAASKQAPVEDDESDAPLVETNKKPAATKGRRGKAAAAAAPAAEEPAATRPTRGRPATKKKQAPVADDEGEPEPEPAEKPKRTYKKRKST